MGNACEQDVNSGNVQLGSTTTVVPQTNVVPITNYQPIIRAGSPIVMAENLCAGSSALSSPACLLGEVSRPSLDRNVRIGPFIGDSMSFGGGFSRSSSLPGRLAPFMGRRPMLMKRRLPKSAGEAEVECVPSATVSCETSVSGGLTEMGSQVSAVPKVEVEPSTVFQNAVEAKAADVEAAPAAHHALAQEVVNLGGHVNVQPLTEVRPEHTYAPSVTSLPTDIVAEAPTYQALDQSSVSLGSTVRVQPTTTVRPLTIYQPSIKSLPLKITQITACDAYAGGIPIPRQSYARARYIRPVPMGASMPF
ncbi:hypothetical protein BGW42_000730 [Actinomortierella wolfii]|nr:hypothetical protein BGW42_000730 [Actinomortierella wolfii]